MSVPCPRARATQGGPSELQVFFATE